MRKRVRNFDILKTFLILPSEKGFVKENKLRGF